ncbi:hypothetical protein BDV23DRAFT_166113 [Aspergillus alliaceus]|uniref:Uncharacterized protein n=1 Tax=Petromyces alliaceus TaxID=209559 RepID=A0A5N7BSN0_PETAA|nr:hypothetical protein BDV23DRAFT_166113 [Aspergillus alliaceus]
MMIGPLQEETSSQYRGDPSQVLIPFAYWLTPFHLAIFGFLFLFFFSREVHAFNYYSSFILKENEKERKRPVPTPMRGEQGRVSIFLL